MRAKRNMRGSCARTAALLCVLLLLFDARLAPAPARGIFAPSTYGVRAAAASPITRVTVTTTADIADGNTTTFATLIGQPGPDAAISLREALQATNSTTTTAALVVAFNIPDADSGYDSGSDTWTIILGANALPPLAHGNVTIDGTSQPGNPGHPQIVLDGYNVYEAPGLSNGITISSAYNTVRGLTLMNFYDDAVLIGGPGAAYNLIAGCYLGTSAAGGLASQPSYFGAELRDGAHHNTIGGSDTAARNLISGNAHSGILIHGSTTTANVVTGNWIGTNTTGRGAIKNAVAGILVSGGAHHNTIGGANAGNLIAGNDVGLYLDGAVATTVAGNTIGLAVDNRTPLGNIGGGIFIVRGASANQIGGTSAAARNLISGNGSGASSFGQGIYVSDATTANNIIQGNYIGVTASGVAPAGNYRQGVLIGGGAHHNSIGGTAEGAGNVIAYNGLGGVRIDSPWNQVAGNLIGVGADGTTRLGNQFNGVRVSGSDTIIGPENTIAYNQQSAIMLLGIRTTVISNTLESNGRSGICVAGANATISGNTIMRNGTSGGPWPDCSIRGGVVIIGTSNALVTQNTILSNQGTGVTVYEGSGNRLLANSISANGTAGISLAQGGNQEVLPPRIDLASESTVSGVTCPLCHVEIFTDSADEGRNFAGETTAGADGAFTLQVTPDDLRDPNVTATRTDSNGNTSPFAKAVSISDETPTPGPAPTPIPTPLPSRRVNMYLPLVSH
jgi:parallel beta-helix repeat protein